ncbi:hypothetical protein GCM10020367_58380 [Streptomyces sannanensis]|uniref:histidine kinase n=1 Tax=Streptomyces sannanensis TaxID=285536 RepID=A0ABP6SKJ3_9ACTN
MSHLRAPAARPDRREDGRHGRQTTRPQPSAGGRPVGLPQPVPQPPPEAGLRPQLLRTSVLPSVATTLSGTAAVAFTFHATAARLSAALCAALAGTALLAFAAVAGAAMGADRIAGNVAERCDILRGGTARAQADLSVFVEGLRRGEGPPAWPAPPHSTPLGGEFDLLAKDLNRTHEAAVTAVVQAWQRSSSACSEQKVEVLAHLGCRLQSLVHREISLLDELERDVEDPDLLGDLFRVDHLATRIRRHAENLAILGGATSRYQWRMPVGMAEVLRSSLAEVEHYTRVKLVPPAEGTLRGHAVADVIHLLAELIENATVFSAPHTEVLLRAQRVAAGLAVEVEDRGLGMPVTEQVRMNALLADPDQVNTGRLLQDGRIGLYVVAALARRHGITVRLQANIYGGIQAVLVLPQSLLGPDQEDLAFHEPAPVPAVFPVVPPTLGDQGPARRNTTVPALGVVPPPVRGAYVVRTGPGGAYTGPTAESSASGGPVGRPRLPRRRARENLARQLRDTPRPRTHSEAAAALPDPGLMAAFQRGAGLAETAQPDPQPDTDDLKEQMTWPEK